MVADNRRYQQRDEDERETNSAGQSGDIQGMSLPAEVDSESVRKLQLKKRRDSVTIAQSEGAT